MTSTDSRTQIKMKEHTCQTDNTTEKSIKGEEDWTGS